MAFTGTKPRVLIIGAGLGGIALAQALRKREIPFDIFERDESPTARIQGWAISIQQDFMGELQAATPDNLPPLESVSHLANVGLNSEMAILDARSNRVVFRGGKDHGKPFLRADRAKLRDWLTTGIDIRWNKRFTHYEEDGEGVTAFFQDGTSVRGDILVGADGVGSRVRNQLLPDPSQHPKALQLGVIVGEITATRDQYERWMSIARSFFTIATGSGRIAVALKGVTDDKEKAFYYWILGWKDEAAENDDFWVYRASKAELHEGMLQRLDGVHPLFAEILRSTPVEGMLHPPLRMRDMVPPELPKGRITLLGDAIHPMTPFRGEGGNNAMKDGLRLGGRLGRFDAVDAVSTVLKEYEAEMGPRAKEAVLASRANAYQNAVIG